MIVMKMTMNMTWQKKGGRSFDLLATNDAGQDDQRNDDEKCPTEFKYEMSFFVAWSRQSKNK